MKKCQGTEQTFTIQIVFLHKYLLLDLYKTVKLNHKQLTLVKSELSNT